MLVHSSFMVLNEDHFPKYQKNSQKVLFLEPTKNTWTMLTLTYFDINLNILLQLILLLGGIPFIWGISVNTLGYFGYGPEYEVFLSMFYIIIFI